MNSDAPQAPADLAKIRRVLIVKPSSLGDIVHTLPSLHDLKSSFPDLEITWLANTEWLPLLEGHSQLKGTLGFPRAEFRGLLGGLKGLRWMNDLHHRCAPEVSLDFQGLFRSGLLSWFSRARQRFGLSDAREGAGLFHNFKVEVPKNCHAVDRYRYLASALGADVSQPATFLLPPGTSLSRELPPRFVAIHPFSRGEGKSLTLAQINALCAKSTLPVVLVGRCDPALIRQINVTEPGVDLLNKTTIPELIACLRRATAIVSVDSGPMHLAAALCPDQLLGIHTWSDPRKVGPYPAASWVLKSGEIAHRNDLSAATCGKATAFEDADVDRVIAWISTHS